MLALKKLYNAVAIHYEVADSFGAISQSHASALAQLCQIPLPSGGHILDMGVGDGRFLQSLPQYFSNMHYTGLDISSGMLTSAKQVMPYLDTMEGSAAEASHYVPEHSQDLVLAHFVNAYVSVDTLFDQAYRVLNANGYFSIITSTYESFPVAQRALTDFVARKTWLSRIVQYYYQRGLHQTTVAANQPTLFLAFPDHRFVILAHTQLKIPVCFKDSEALLKFGTEGTWFLNKVTATLASNRLLRRYLRRVCEKIFTFPYHDTHVIEVVLAQKRASPDM